MLLGYLWTSLKVRQQEEKLEIQDQRSSLYLS